MESATSVFNIKWSRPLTLKEAQVFSHYNVTVFGYGFTQDELDRQLLYLLQEHNIISRNINSVPKIASDFIALYVVCLMHGSNISDGDEVIGPLVFGARDKSITIELHWRAHQKSGSVVMPAFSTNIHFESEFSRQLLESEIDFTNIQLELDRDCKITYISQPLLFFS